jgi:hypothetical protein
MAYCSQVCLRTAECLIMDIAAISSMASQVSQQNASQSAQLLVLKKAMQVQQASAQTLIAAVTTPSANLPPHLGQHVNTTA